MESKRLVGREQLLVQIHEFVIRDQVIPTPSVPDLLIDMIATSTPAFRRGYGNSNTTIVSITLLT